MNEGARKAVLQALEDTGYIPDRLYRSLACDLGRTVGVIVPSLTTIALPGYEIGANTARMLLQRLAGETVQPQMHLNFAQVARESTRRIGAGAASKAGAWGAAP